MRLPRLLLAVIAATALMASMALVVTGTVSASSKVGVTRLQESNISDQSFSVSWITSTKVSKAAMFVGTSCKAATTKSSQDPGSNGFVHLANARGGLKAGTPYFVKLSLNGTEYSTCYHVHTYPSMAIPPPPNAVYGTSEVDKTCRTNSGHAAPGTLVVLDVRHKGAASDPLAALADRRGRWAIPFGETTTPAGQFVNPTKGDQIEITGWQDKSHNDFDGTTYQGSTKLVGPWTVCIAHK